ncbi:tetratricopeptide repeat protein [Candidatus Halobeggiatoa sp. HSG11]|nr:tetratricopeptide repeat protein [Candidatus Halobeggiatoa sp. HSG11]
MLDELTDFNEKVVEIKAKIAKLEPDDWEALATGYYELGKECYELKTGDGFEQAVLAYERAIELREKLSLNDENCNELARIYIGLGNTLDDIGTGDSLKRSRELYSKALELREGLAINDDECRNELAITYKRYGNAQVNLGSTTDLRQAIKFYQKAINIGENLSKDNHNFQVNLANCYMLCGIARTKLGSYNDLQQAIKLYKYSINISKNLPEDNHKFQNGLANTYHNLGFVQSELGTKNSLIQAIKYYQKAITIRKKLPKDNLQFQKDLSNTYNNIGNIQSDLNTKNSLEQALKFCQKVITIREKLPKDNYEFQDDLASAYNNIGLVQNNLGDLNNLQQAIKFYQQAISIRKKLPKDNHQFQNNLARAYMNLGTTYKDLGNPNDLQQAIKFYQQAISIGEKLPQNNHEFQNDLARAYGNKSIAYLKQGNFEEANEAAETGLELLRDLEINGNYVLRSRREWLFDLTVDTYSTPILFKFLPEFVLEHLDPVSEGAASQSAKMHRSALNGLKELAVFAYYQAPDLIFETQQTIFKLQQIASLYFAGTATAAKLLAQYNQQQVKNSKQAEQILKEYIEQCPNDVEGYQNLGEFYRNTKNWSAAIQCNIDGAKAIGTSLPKHATEQDLEQVTDTITLFIDSCILVRLQQSNQIAEYDAIEDWLTDFPTLFTDRLKSLLTNHIKTKIRPELRQKRDEWLNKSQQELEKSFATNNDLITQALRETLPKNMQYLIEQLSYTQTELAKLDITNEERLERLTQRAEQLISKLYSGEVQEEQQTLANQLPEIWPNLDIEDHKLLATALYCLNNENQELLRLAGVNLGIALERSLTVNWLKPVRDNLSYNPNFPLSTTDSGLVKGFLLPKYFKNSAMPSKLTLSDLISAFTNIILKAEQRPESELKQQLFDYIQQNTDNLLNNSNNKTRRQNLDLFREKRNRCPHFKDDPFTKQDAQDMFNILIESDDAFYKYFVGGFEIRN